MSDVQRIRRFFIDESGNTGGATRIGAAFDFDNQPIFVLACLGIEDEIAFAAAFAEWKKRYRFRGAEVKSDAAWEKPGFYMDLLVEIERLDLPLLLEVVDKRFFIAAQMVNSLILPPVGADIDHSPPLTFMRNAIAEFITEVLSPSCLAAFVQACIQAEGDAILRTYAVLLEALAGEPAGGFCGFIRMAAVDTRNDFLEQGPNDPEVVRRHLPLPDLNPHGKPVRMLPHLSSLTNLYARLNTYTGGKLQGVTLIHDEQLQFDKILRTNKIAAEGLAAQGLKMTYGPANYVFSEEADLVFEESGRSPGLQAADVIAGYAMRLLVNRLIPGVRPRHDRDWLLRRLLDQDNPQQGLGTNFVMTTAKMRTIGISSAPDPFLLPW